jgi:hypothetical protein
VTAAEGHQGTDPPAGQVACNSRSAAHLGENHGVLGQGDVVVQAADVWVRLPRRPDGVAGGAVAAGGQHAHCQAASGGSGLGGRGSGEGAVEQGQRVADAHDDDGRQAGGGRGAAQGARAGVPRGRRIC